MECEYCKSTSKEKNDIYGKVIRTSDLKLTAGYRANMRTDNNTIGEYLYLFILKGKADKKAGLMVETVDGARYIDINYCPFCGRNLESKGE